MTSTKPRTPRRRKPLPAPPPAVAAMFDVTLLDAPAAVAGAVIERVPLSQITLAPNPRKTMTTDGLRMLAESLMRTGQVIPAIGRRDAEDSVIVYEGQRRLRAAELSHQLAATEGFEDLKPVIGLLVLLVDHEPTQADIWRLQAAANVREDLGFGDQLEQFADCWEARGGVPEDERIILVGRDLGIGAGAARNCLRCLSLPQEVRSRVSRRPAGDEISIRLALTLAKMNSVSPALARSVAGHITTGELHDSALQDLGGFVHRTLVDDPDVYAVRVDVGALLDAQAEANRARLHVTDKEQQRTIRAMLAAARPAPAEGEKQKPLGDVGVELGQLAAKAGARSLKIKVDQDLRDRAAQAGGAWVHERGEAFAAGVWITDPVVMLDEVLRALAASESSDNAREEAFFKGADVKDDDVNDAREAAQAQRAHERHERDIATTSNLTLGDDLTATLIDPSPDQLRALRDFICMLLAEMYPDIIAYGAGWTDRANQHPVGDTDRFQPRPAAEIIERELDRALKDTDPLRGIATLAARFCAAFLLNPDGTTRTTILGADRMSRRLTDALPGGSSALRAAVWEFMGPALSPRLKALNRDAFAGDAMSETVDLASQREVTPLGDLDLGDEPAGDA